MLAVVASSARLLAELVRASGRRVVALDVFGDADTRAAAEAWIAIGEPPRIDAARLLAALDMLAAGGRVNGFIAGSGLEAHAGLLEAAAARLPLIGTASGDVQRVRDARQFFAALDELGLAHPPVRFEPPGDLRPVAADRTTWLVKQPASCGGWGVRQARHGDDAEPGVYWQAERSARVLSATLVADGRSARLLGINEQITQRIGACPFVFTGVIGPLDVGARLRRRVDQAARALSARFRLRGLASLDFLLADDEAEPEWLEVNPRVPASAALYAGLDPIGLHLLACADGELPPDGPQDAPPPAVTHGMQIVFADRAVLLSSAQSDLIARWPGAHDLPAPGTAVQPGAPLCSLFASGASAPELRRRLAESSRRLLQGLHACEGVRA